LIAHEGTPIKSYEKCSSHLDGHTPISTFRSTLEYIQKGTTQKVSNSDREEKDYEGKFDGQLGQVSQGALGVSDDVCSVVL
jgi:hypothetical protein